MYILYTFSIGKNHILLKDLIGFEGSGNTFLCKGAFF